VKYQVVGERLVDLEFINPTTTTKIPKGIISERPIESTNSIF